jgi:putative SOS response-associated peptidase YedK
MIITEPNDFAAEIHDRMPMFLTGKIRAVAEQRGWRRNSDASSKRLPATLAEVSKRVNSPKADPDDPALIDRVDLAVA